MAKATMVPESVDKLFGKKGSHTTEFDRYIAERLEKGDDMSDLVLCVPKSLGAPDEVHTRYGRLWVLSSAQVDRCYLLSVRDKPPDGMVGVTKKGRDSSAEVSQEAGSH